MLGRLHTLVGTWEGTGHGVYPTIDPFDYEERAEFTHSGKPFVVYRQSTWKAATPGEPLHTETGYFRPDGAEGIEVVIAQPTGITEILTGAWQDRTIRLASVFVGLTPTAKEVRTVERILHVEDDTLTYELWMEAVGRSHQIHLSARLARVD